MSEEYNWITGGIEGGGEIPPEAIQSITVVSDNIQDVALVAAQIREAGDLTTTDGNVRTIKVKRQNDADWQLANPVLDVGELALIMDSSPQIVKIGDGITAFEDLPVLFSTSSININDIAISVQACKDAQAASEAAAASAITKADQATSASTSAVEQAVLAEKWAIEEGTSTLPNGEKSAKENARLAGLRAQESRLVKRRTTIVAAELMSSSALYRITPVKVGAPIIVTVPAQLYASANDEEAWAIYRLEQTGGTIQFLPQTGGSDLQAPFVKAQVRFFRKVATVTTGQATVTGRFTIPAVTAGKLCIAALVNHTTVSALTNSCTLTGGLTATVVRPLANQTVANTISSIYWEAPLTAFAGADIDITISSGPSLQTISVFAWAVEGMGATASRNTQIRATSGANITALLAALDKSSLVLACAAKRGNESDEAFSSFSSNIGLQASGGTASAPDPNQTDPIKNMVWGSGYGVANVTADFSTTAAWNVSTNPICLLLISLPPKTVIGAGNAILNYKGGIDTLSTLYGKAVLWFNPDGKNVIVDVA